MADHGYVRNLELSAPGGSVDVQLWREPGESELEVIVAGELMLRLDPNERRALAEALTDEDR